MNKYKDSIKKYYYCFILGPFFMILEACGEFILPYLSARIIEEGSKNQDMQYILINGLYMVLLAAAMLVVGVLGANFAIRGAAHLAADVRMKTFMKIQKFSFENIDDFSTGSLITRITNDITQIQTFCQSLLRGVFRSPVMLIGAIVMSFRLNPKMAMVICVIVPILTAGIAIVIKVASPRYTIMQEKIDGLNNSVNETLTNEYVIKSFVREEYEKKKFEAVNDVLMEKSIRALKMMILMQPMSTAAISIATVGVVYLAGGQVMVGTMDVATLTAFITYLTQVLMSLNMLANIVLQGTRAVASDRRITEVINAEIELNDDNATCPDKLVAQGSVEFKNVSFKYFKNNREQVLDNINLKINGGEFIGIVGSTGSGKTTLISMIPRLYDVDGGEVLVDGVNVKEWSIKNLREGVAVVLQKNSLFSGTITENLAWGNENATMDEIKWAAGIAQAKEFVEGFAEQYDTELEQGGSNLSGGQRQRLCIARALIKKPKILILDDSTSAVDTATDARIRKAFREELPDVTKIVIAQRINSVIDADKIIVLDEGRVVGYDEHSVLIKECQEYQEIYYSQKDKDEEVKSHE